MLYFEDFKEGEKIKFMANADVRARAWDDKKSIHTSITKDNVYDGVIQKDLGVIGIGYTGDQGKAAFMSYEYADGKIDILEPISN